MVFWSSLLKRIKENVPGPEFLKLKKKVEKNSTDISTNTNKINTNTSNIQTNTDNINTLNETVNTNSSDISVIKNKYAKKDEINSWTASQNFDRGGTFREDLNVFGDKKFKFGWDTNDVKLTVESVSGKKDAKISATQANLLITAKNNVEINKLKEPTNNDDAATKSYVDNKVASVPSPDLSAYLTKIEAQADYARCKDGINNDWYSTNTFRKTPQVLGSISNAKDIATKEYVDGIISSGGTLYIKESKYIYNGTKNGAGKFEAQMTLELGDALTWNSKMVGVKLEMEWTRSGYKHHYQTFNWEGYVRGADGSLSYTYGARIFTDENDAPPTLYCYYERLSDPYAEQNVKVIATVYHI